MREDFQAEALRQRHSGIYEDHHGGGPDGWSMLNKRIRVGVEIRLYKAQTGSLVGHVRNI